MTIGKNLLLILFLAVFSIAQHFSWLNIFGIKPNLALIFLTALFFVLENFFFYLILIFISYFLLKIEPVFDLPVFVLSLLLVVGFWLARIFPWQKIFSLSFFIILITSLFYLIISPQFIIHNTVLLIGEILYNLVLGLAVYYILIYLYGKKSTAL